MLDVYKTYQHFFISEKYLAWSSDEDIKSEQKSFYESI